MAHRDMIISRALFKNGLYILPPPDFTVISIIIFYLTKVKRGGKPVEQEKKFA
jgi:hypothetical protein